jgi:hypothetical protein
MLWSLCYVLLYAFCSMLSQALVCTGCSSSFTTTSRLHAALEHGFQRCFGKPMPSEDEVYQLVWTGLPPQPSRLDARAYDCWLLQCAAVQFTVSIQDWRHRGSCFKGKRCHCRYKTPILPCDCTSVAPVLDVGGDATAAPVLKLDINVQRRPCFASLTTTHIHAPDRPHPLKSLPASVRIHPTPVPARVRPTGHTNSPPLTSKQRSPS